MPKTRFIAVLSALAATSFAAVPIALAASGPMPLTYGVTVNGFINNRLYNLATTPNANTLAASALVNGALDPVGRGDPAINVAPVKNPSGYYNLYVASLIFTNVDVSTSTSGGSTLATNYPSSRVPLTNRDWLAARSPSTVYLSYHDIATDNIDVERSDAAAGAGSWSIPGEAINPLSNANVMAASNDNELGNIAATPNGKYVYQILVGAVGTKKDARGYPMRGVYMAVSNNGGRTFKDCTVDVARAGTAFGHQFPQVALDSAGNVYAVYSDNHNLFLSISRNRGQTWSGPYQVNHTGPAPSPLAPYATSSTWLPNPNSSNATDGQPESYSLNPAPDSYYQQELIPAYSNVSIKPLLVAGEPGKVDIVWYGTNMTTGADGAFATHTTDDHVHWAVFMAQSTNALAGKPAFVEMPITPVVHRGGLSEAGLTGPAGGEDNRDLFDDFGIAVNPTNGLASVAYTSDQLDPTDSTYYSQENSSAHTGYAIQSSAATFAPIMAP